MASKSVASLLYVLYIVKFPRHSVPFLREMKRSLNFRNVALNHRLASLLHQTREVRVPCTIKFNHDVRKSRCAIFESRATGGQITNKSQIKRNVAILWQVLSLTRTRAEEIRRKQARGRVCPGEESGRSHEHSQRSRRRDCGSRK